MEITDGFYEDDEPMDELMAAFEAGEKRYTSMPMLTWPQSWCTCLRGYGWNFVDGPPPPCVLHGRATALTTNTTNITLPSGV